MVEEKEEEEEEEEDADGDFVVGIRDVVLSCLGAGVQCTPIRLLQAEGWSLTGGGLGPRTMSCENWRRGEREEVGEGEGKDSIRQNLPLLLPLLLPPAPNPYRRAVWQT